MAFLDTKYKSNRSSIGLLLIMVACLMMMIARGKPVIDSPEPAVPSASTVKRTAVRRVDVLPPPDDAVEAAPTTTEKTRVTLWLNQWVRGQPPFMPLGGFDQVPRLRIAESVPVPILSVDASSRTGDPCESVFLLDHEGTHPTTWRAASQAAERNSVEEDLAACFRINARRHAEEVETDRAWAAWIYAVSIDYLGRRRQDVELADAIAGSLLDSNDADVVEALASWEVGMMALNGGFDSSRVARLRQTIAWDPGYEAVVAMWESRNLIGAGEDVKAESYILQAVSELDHICATEQPDASRPPMGYMDDRYHAVCATMSDFLSYATMMGSNAQLLAFGGGDERCLSNCLAPVRQRCDDEQARTVWRLDYADQDVSPTWHVLDGPGCLNMELPICMTECGIEKRHHRVRLWLVKNTGDWNTRTMTTMYHDAQEQ